MIESGITFRKVRTHRLSFFIAESGRPRSPLVLFLHGFPESWYMWRKQLSILGAAGFHAVAPDMPGYGETDAPAEIERYSQTALGEDLISLVDALQADNFFVVGHDFGASLGWHMALAYPDRVSRLVNMTVPFGGRSPFKPTDLMKRLFRDRFFYMLHFQEPGAEALLNANPRQALLSMYASASAGSEAVNPLFTPPEEVINASYKLPAWLEKLDLGYLVARYRYHGFGPPLNYYRNLDRYWEETEHLADKPIETPTLYLYGSDDPVNFLNKKAFSRMPTLVPGLQRVEEIEHCGHWMSCEQPALITRLVLDFLDGKHEAT